MTFSKVISDPMQIRENTKHLLYMMQSGEGEAPFGLESDSELPAMDFGYVESQKAEFNVFMATMEQLLRAD